MSFTSTIVGVGLLMTVLALIIVIYVTFKYRKGELTTEPGKLQFSNLKNIPGEDYVDLNIVKTGKTKTLRSYNSSGFISWEAFFNPKTKVDMQNRIPATLAIFTLFGIGIIITATMKLLEITVGYFFGLAFLFLASALVLIQFIRFKIVKKK